MAAAVYLKGFYTFCLLIRFAAVCVLRKEEGGHILGNGFLGMKAESSCCDDMIYFLLFFLLLLVSKEKGDHVSCAAMDRNELESQF